MKKFALKFIEIITSVGAVASPFLLGCIVYFILKNKTISDFIINNIDQNTLGAISLSVMILMVPGCGFIVITWFAQSLQQRFIKWLYETMDIDLRDAILYLDEK